MGRTTDKVSQWGRLALTAAICAGLGVEAARVAAQRAAVLKPRALQEMVETERAFAALGAEKGVAESFFKYFGEEGIGFSPHPGKFREQARKNPPPNPPPPREFRLEWWPSYGDVSAGGDMGYNTGPTLVTDIAGKGRPPQHGRFFSVWKKQPSGIWEVAVDMGVGSPEEYPAWNDRLKYTRVPQEKFKAKKIKDAAAGRAEMLELETALGRAATSGGRDAYLGYMSPTCLVNRSGYFVLIGKDAIAKHFDSIKLAVVSSEGIDGGVAKSGEMGYTYGRFEVKVTREGTERTVKGYFTHVWKRNAQGEWKLVADVANALPPNAPPPQ